MSETPNNAAAPNWAEITTEPHCPLCEYMLRGLSNPRCPECGYKFEWPEVLEASRRDHPYLFEHFRDRNIWSYLKTVLGALRPRKFWSMLHPGQRGSIPRLIIFWLVGFIISATVVLLIPLIFVIAEELMDRQFSPYAHLAFNQRPFWAEVGHRLDNKYFGRHALRGFGIMLLVMGAWPWILHLTLQLFTESMRKAKIRPVHVLRCVIYSMDLTFLALMLLIAAFVAVGAMLIEFRSANGNRISGLRPEEIIAWAVLAALVIYTFRLAVAYRRYLRFDHSPAVAFSAQLITALSIFTFLILFVR